MTEEPILKDDTVKAESEKTTTLPEADKKRVMLGTIIGGLMFLGILIAIICMVSTEEIKPHPVPINHKNKTLPYYNPFIIKHVEEREKYILVTASNNRTYFERPQNTGLDMPTSIPVVKNTTNNVEVEELQMHVNVLDEHLINIKYVDPIFTRWEVPDFGHSEDPYYQTVSKQIRSNMNFHVSMGDTFEWKFNGNNVDLLPLLTTEGCRFQFFDKYVEFEARVQTDYIYGMGERMESFYLKNDNYSLWNRHHPYDLGGDTERGLYSSHPFFLNRLKDKKDFIGVFMKNSNAMLFSMWHTLNTGTYINYKMIGGTVDLYIFHEADPDYILKKYHSLIGRPYLPPLWAMGFQQARVGYTLQDLETVVNTHREKDIKIPIDAVWADADMMEDYKVFTVNSKAYTGVKEFVQKLHDLHEGIDMHFVAMTNPGIKELAGYKYYDQTIKDRCYIQSASEFDKPYRGRTVAGVTIWLDFFMHEATLVWAEGLHDLHDLTLFDGVWISENEITNYQDAEPFTTSADNGDAIPNPFHSPTEFDYIQYRPTLDPLERDTIPMSAYQCCDEMYSKQYFTHNLYGLQSAKATYDSLRGIFEHKRFLIASRSTWPGSGQYSSHWLDGNYATWESMKASIASMLNFNMFGIPHVGAPIGGYYHSSTPELLARWFELGCFSPLMLSYTDSNTNHKEVYADKTIMPYIKNAMLERYSLIRFMYTKMFESFLWGGPVIHPLFFEFPEDEELYKRDILDRTFMWAKTLYIIPALIPGQIHTKAYLPNWRWYDMRTWDMVLDHNPSGTGEYMYFEQPLGYITTLIKGGSIVPYQYESKTANVMNVEDLNLINARLVIAPDHDGKAIGTMVIDAEGIRPIPDPKSESYRMYTFTYMNQIFRINKLVGFDFHEEHAFDYFDEILILDAQKHPDFACMMKTDMRKLELEYQKTVGSNVLTIKDYNRVVPMFDMESIVWGTTEEHDFCKFQVHLASATYSNEDRTMIGELATSDPFAYQLKFDIKVSALTDSIVSMQVTMVDKNVAQWTVPDVIEEEVRNTLKGKKKLSEVGFRTSPLYEPFAFEMADPEDPRDFVFTTRNMPFVYIRNFIHLKFMVNSRHLFGLGERVGKFELTDGVYSLWSYDMTSQESGLPPGNNMYGSHPFYIAHMHNPHKFAGIFFLNSNAIDVKIRHVGMQTTVDHMFSGGIIDAFFIQEGSVEQIMRSYHYLVGRPVPLPFWAFGYHQSRWGYRDSVHLKDIIRQFDEFNVPLDAIWMDKDYMNHYRTFTIDKENWGDIKTIVDDLHKKNRHFVAIVDPTIARDVHFDLYQEGLALNAYIKISALDHNPLVGVTWPGYSVWVDFVNPTAVEFWETCLTRLYKEVEFDGLWLDMNEPSNFCDGDCNDGVHYNYYYFPMDYYDDLYYNPTHRGLERGTVSMEATHYGDPVLHSEFNYHTLYGLIQSRVTAKYFMSHLNKRPFIISSSTFPGSSRWAAHWLGDNYSSWHYMEYSIAGMMNFQLFGIPFVGADICGFSGNATENLCSRWMQLGAFYPFMRNHNGPTGENQEPFAHPKLLTVSRKALHLRYRLARYLYSEYMHTAHRGGLIIKPLLFDFPEDNNTYTILDNTFMFGAAIKVTPVLDDKVDMLQAYFPNNDWFEYPSFKHVMHHNASSRYGQTLDLHCSLDSENINLHIRGGRIFVEQEHSDGVNNLEQLHDLPINLIVAPNDNHTAVGDVYYDDEDHTTFRDQHRDYLITMNNTEIMFRLVSGSLTYKYPKKDQFIHTVKILNAKEFSGTNCAKYVELETKNTKSLNIKYADEILELTPVDDNSMSADNVDHIVWSNTGSC